MDVCFFFFFYPLVFLINIQSRISNSRDANKSEIKEKGKWKKLVRIGIGMVCLKLKPLMGLGKPAKNKNRAKTPMCLLVLYVKARGKFVQLLCA